MLFLILLLIYYCFPLTIYLPIPYQQLELKSKFINLTYLNKFHNRYGVQIIQRGVEE